MRVDPAHGGVADLRSGQLIVSNLVSNLSPGCAKLSAMGTITINPDDVPVTVVSDTFNVNEVIRFTINPVSGDASVSSSGIGLEGQILPRAEVFDISNQSSFILTVTGAGRGTIAIQNGDTRQRVMRITLSCAITLPTATKSTPPQGIPRACQSYFNLAQQTPCGANGNCTGRRQLLCIYQTCLKNGGRMPLTPAESQQCSRAEDLRTPLVQAHASRECQYPAAQAFARDVR